MRLPADPSRAGAPSRKPAARRALLPSAAVLLIAAVGALLRWQGDARGAGGIRRGETTPRRPAAVRPARASLVPSPRDPAPAADAAQAQFRRDLAAWVDDDDPAWRDARIAAAEAALARAGDGSMAARLQWLEALPDDLLEFALGLPSVGHWMAAEPAAALDWLARHPGVAGGRVEAVLAAWQSRAAADVDAYLAAAPPGPWRERLVTAATYAALPDDPRRAWRWAGGVQDSDTRASLLALALAGEAQADPERAAVRAGRIADPATRALADAALAGVFAREEPELAARWAATELPVGPVRDRALAEIAGAWAAQDPAAGLAWVQTFPAGDARRAALGAVVTAWSVRDPDSLAAWAQLDGAGPLQTEAAPFVLAALGGARSRDLARETR